MSHARPPPVATDRPPDSLHQSEPRTTSRSDLRQTDQLLREVPRGDSTTAEFAEDIVNDISQPEHRTDERRRDWLLASLVSAVGDHAAVSLALREAFDPPPQIAFVQRFVEVTKPPFGADHPREQVMRCDVILGKRHFAIGVINIRGLARAVGLRQREVRAIIDRNAAFGADEEAVLATQTAEILQTVPRKPDEAPADHFARIATAHALHPDWHGVAMRRAADTHPAAPQTEPRLVLSPPGSLGERLNSELHRIAFRLYDDDGRVHHLNPALFDYGQWQIPPTEATAAQELTGHGTGFLSTIWNHVARLPDGHAMAGDVRRIDNGTGPETIEFEFAVRGLEEDVRDALARSTMPTPGAVRLVVQASPTDGEVAVAMSVMRTFRDPNAETFLRVRLKDDALRSAALMPPAASPPAPSSLPPA